MRKITIFIWALAVALGYWPGIAGALAQPASDNDGERRSRPAGDNSPANAAEMWDENRDGVYTCAEWKVYLERWFYFADHNRDGRLDAPEFAEVRASKVFAEAEFGYFDENQDGKITRAEFVEKPSPFILRFDRNGDCRVTAEELKAPNTDQKRPAGKGKRS